MACSTDSSSGVALRVPRHLAVIMDGNGRWAEARGQIRITGHPAGALGGLSIIEADMRHGISFLTLYDFSS